MGAEEHTPLHRHTNNPTPSTVTFPHSYVITACFTQRRERVLFEQF
jgi:hypothetical protein